MIITNVYFDESCHVGAGGENIVFGALWCDREAKQELADAVKILKSHHGISARREIKWTKVSRAKLQYYKDLIDLFVMNEDLNFRAIVVAKNKLNHDAYGTSEDGFYYRMLYGNVKNIAQKREGSMRIYVDYKDIWSTVKSRKTAQYLQNTAVFSKKEFTAQSVRSNEVAGLQMADLLMGIVMYANKSAEERQSAAKNELVQYAQDKLKQDFTQNTPISFEKFNIFHLRNPRIQ